MNQDVVKFQVTELAASVLNSVLVEWQGKEFDSGPLTIELDETAQGSCGEGVLDYSQRRARAEFHVRLSFSQLANILNDLGVSAELTQPVRAVLRSEGKILEDHSFFLSGRCDLLPHGLLTPDHTRAAVLPGT